MARYHVRADGSMGVCTAKEGHCPFGAEDGTKHFTNETEARAYSERMIAGKSKSRKALKRDATTAIGKDAARERVCSRTLYGDVDVDKARAEVNEIQGARRTRSLASQAQVVSDFREETERRFHEIYGWTAVEIESTARDEIIRAFEDAGINAVVGETVLDGSRSRGLEREDSDIDVVVEILESDLGEDALFDVLHDEDLDLEIEGIPVDVNPIRLEETGSLGDYLRSADAYLRNKEAQGNEGRIWRERRNDRLAVMGGRSVVEDVQQ